MTHRPILALALALVSAVPVTAAAQSRTAEAESLFREGKRLMADGDYAPACEAFAASEQREPALSTRLNLADCREKNGQLATAWGLFVDIERETRADKRQAGVYKAARARAAALETRLSYLTISVPDDSRVDGLVVTRNGVVVEDTLWNRALPVDGGQIVVAGRAPGHEEWSTTLTVQDEGGKVSVEVPRFKAIKDVAVEAPAVSREPEPEAESVDVEPVLDVPARAPRLWTGRRKVALGVGVAGLAAAGAGVWLGLDARGLAADAATLCPEPSCERADDANALVTRAEQRARLANLGYGVGAAALVGAAVLWLTGDDERPRLAPTASAGFSGVHVTGSF